MEHLEKLENDTIFILRESFRKIPNLAMLWSIGKDSTVLLWLVRKAFLGHCPFPLIHIDTTYKMPEMIAYRDKVVKEWNLNLIVGKNHAALAEGMNVSKGKLECCTALKTNALQQTITQHGFRGLLLGIRRDEDPTRAKERVFSPRNENFEWEFKDQPPEFWNQFKTDYPENVHIRVHPILNWTELDIWLYIHKEKIPIIDLYFSREGRRYRTLGCAPCTGSISSGASSVEEVIDELRSTKVSERSGRAQDQAAQYAMQKLRAKGYM
jgi:sulfate adenylyltransferase subunit 2